MFFRSLTFLCQYRSRKPNVNENFLFFSFTQGRANVQCKWLGEGLKQAVFYSSSSSFSSSTLRASFKDENEDEINGEVCVLAQVITQRTSHLREWMEQRCRSRAAGVLPIEPPGSAGLSRRSFRAKADVSPASRKPKTGTRRRDASAPRNCAPVQGFNARFLFSGNSHPQRKNRKSGHRPRFQ